jgi:hypothetical protein
MCFSNEDLKKLQEGQLEVAGKCQHLVEIYLRRDYTDKHAREYAEQGFSRRLKTLARCIDNVFRILPPDRIELPSSDERYDAMINIQAFVFNVFGSIDNLARIWVQEKPVRNENGSPIPNSWVGLGKDNNFVRSSLSTEFQQYLKGLDDWFDYLGNFRHALAHRIPLYIPPYTIPPDKVAAYQQLEAAKWGALKEGDFAEHDRLKGEQEETAKFIPAMTHSLRIRDLFYFIPNC